jgi:hypothetical protein
MNLPEFEGLSPRILAQSSAGRTISVCQGLFDPIRKAILAILASAEPNSLDP